ncbi:MAG: helix-turn-helix transcriptional regulator [Bacteroidales bacterium]|nr:helix-turn-helix transcriptional regulator [Bacteroidales bacterium]
MDKFRVNMKMAELVEVDFHLLGVLSRLGIIEAFGERTVEDVCLRNGLDAGTFILLCSVYADPEFQPTAEQLRAGHIGDVLRYLHQSHEYYLNSAMVTLASSIEKLIAPCSATQQKVIWKFFQDYKIELEKHFRKEEGEVVPYVQKLMIGQREPGAGIDGFEEDHSNIDESLSDLKNLILKSLPAECDGRMRLTLLNYVYHLQHDLERHSEIEDKLMAPMARLLENPAAGFSASVKEQGPEQNKGELSDREKEILVNVAQGLLNKEIADRLGISINTVITHRKNITRKTGIRTVAGLTVYAILNNLIDISTIE